MATPDRRSQAAHGLIAGSVAGVATVGAGAFVRVVTGSAPTTPAVLLSTLVLAALGALTGATFAASRVGSLLLERTTAAAVLLLALIAASALALLAVGQRPARSDRPAMAALLVAALVGVAGATPLARRAAGRVRHRLAGSRVAPDDLAVAFETGLTRAVPLDELLDALTAQLRTGLDVAAAEVWTGESATMRLAAARPRREPTELVLDEAALPALRSTSTNGGTWAAVWVPALVGGADPSDLRVAPIMHDGLLAGILVLRARPGTAPFDDASDRMLTRVGRALGLVLHNARLDAELAASTRALAQANAELRSSRARLVATADAERRKLERDLHDGAQQHLIAMAVTLRQARDALDTEPSVTEALLARLQDALRDAGDELRSLAHGIYPPQLLTGGVAEAVGAAAGRARSPVELDVDLPARLPHDVEATLYFCAVEALQNADKHAGPDAEVAIRMWPHEGGIAFSIADDGVGFDDRMARGKGQGLVNIADRVGAVGGRVAIRGTPGSGARVEGWIPLPRAVGQPEPASDR